MNLDDTRPTPGKTRVYRILYLQKSRLPEKYLDGSRPTCTIHGPPEDGRRRVEGRRTGPEDLLRHTRPHERVGARTARRGAHGGITHGGGAWATVERCGQGN